LQPTKKGDGKELGNKSLRPCKDKITTEYGFVISVIKDSF